MKHKTFKDRLLSALKSEADNKGISWNELKKLDRYDKDLMSIIGKLLIEYPVSFHIEFFIEVLDLCVPEKFMYAFRAKEVYFQSIRKRA